MKAESFQDMEVHYDKTKKVMQTEKAHRSHVQNASQPFKHYPPILILLNSGSNP